MAGAQKECEFEADTTALQPVVFQFHSYKVTHKPRDTTALQPVVFQLHSYDSEPQSGNRREVSKVLTSQLAVKLKYHRLKPGGVQRRAKGCL